MVLLKSKCLNVEAIVTNHTMFALAAIRSEPLNGTTGVVVWSPG